MQLGAKVAISIAVLVLCLISHRLSAEEQTVLKPLDRPDPASVTVPKLVATSGDDYSYFYKAGVSYEKAFSDLDECRMYSLSAQLYPLPPRFVPLGSAPMKAESLGCSTQCLMMYGLTGVLLAAVIIPNIEDDEADATNRRCMAYKGYSRFGAPRAIWTQISAGTDAEKLARMALIASGPQPPAEAIGP